LSSNIPRDQPFVPEYSPRLNFCPRIFHETNLLSPKIPRERFFSQNIPRDISFAPEYTTRLNLSPKRENLLFLTGRGFRHILTLVSVAWKLSV
jgi:hypothetical protein